MECEGIKELLSAYLDGELTEEESGTVRAHLERCPDCRREIEQFRKVSALYRDLDDPEPPADLEKRVLAEVGRMRMMRVPVRTRFFFFPKPLLALAATVLVVCGAAAIAGLLIPTREPMRLAKTDVEDELPTALPVEQRKGLEEVVEGVPAVIEPEGTRAYSKQEAARDFLEVPEVLARARTEQEEMSAEVKLSRPAEPAPVPSKEVVADLEAADKVVELARAAPDTVSEEKVAAGVIAETAKMVREAAVEEQETEKLKPRAEPATPATFFEHRGGAAPSQADIGPDDVRRFAARQPRDDGGTRLGLSEESAARYERALGGVRDATEYAVPVRESTLTRGLPEGVVVAGKPLQVSERGRVEPVLAPTDKDKPAKMFPFRYDTVIPIGEAISVEVDGPETIRVEIEVVSAQFKRDGDNVAVEIVLEHAADLPEALERDAIVLAIEGKFFTVGTDTGEGKLAHLPLGELELAALWQDSMEEVPARETERTFFGLAIKGKKMSHKVVKTVGAEKLAGARIFSIELKRKPKRPEDGSNPVVIPRVRQSEE